MNVEDKRGSHVPSCMSNVSVEADDDKGLKHFFCVVEGEESCC